MMTWDGTREVVLFVLALYAAGLSTLNWIQSKNREKRSIRVTADTAIPAYNDGRLGAAHAQIKAVNIGHRPVTITHLTFEVPGRRRIGIFEPSSLGQDTPLPAHLNDGQSAQAHISYRDLGVALSSAGMSGRVIVTPICEDSTGAVYRGEPWEVDIEEFTQR